MPLLEFFLLLLRRSPPGPDLDITREGPLQVQRAHVFSGIHCADCQLDFVTNKVKQLTPSWRVEDKKWSSGMLTRCTPAAHIQRDPLSSTHLYSPPQPHLQHLGPVCQHDVCRRTHKKSLQGSKSIMISISWHIVGFVNR